MTSTAKFDSAALLAKLGVGAENLGACLGPNLWQGGGPEIASESPATGLAIARVRRVTIRFAHSEYRCDTHGITGARDSDRDFASVGDKQTMKRCRHGCTLPQTLGPVGPATTDLQAGHQPDINMNHQGIERFRVDLHALVNVDGAPHVAVEARVEELGRVGQGSALMEGQ